MANSLLASRTRVSGVRMAEDRLWVTDCGLWAVECDFGPGTDVFGVRTVGCGV